jgi:hypothetical protein
MLPDQAERGELRTMSAQGLVRSAGQEEPHVCKRLCELRDGVVPSLGTTRYEWLSTVH